MKLWPLDVMRVPESRCLNCGLAMNALGTEDGSEAKAAPGDIAICIKCGAVMKLDDRLRLRGMSEAEINRLLADHKWMDQVARMVGAVHFMRSNRQTGADEN